MDLSVIIPVYNTEPQILKRCLNSILELDEVDYEIILIDDGSKIENSIEYKKIIKNVNKIKYIYTKNNGVSSARNLGIRESSGKYLMFVDSDDCIIPNNLKLNYLNKNKDIFIFDKIYVKKDNSKNNYIEFELKEGNVEKNYLMKEFIAHDKFHTTWGKLICKDFLIKNEIFFDSNLIQGEDAIFNLNMLMASPSIYYIDVPIYEYYYDIKTSNGRWNKYADEMTENIIFLYKKKRECIDYINFPKEEKELINQLNENIITSLFIMLMNLCENTEKNKDNINIILEYLEECQINIKNYKILTKIKFKLMNYRKMRIIYKISIIRKMYLRYLKK